MLNELRQVKIVIKQNKYCISLIIFSYKTHGRKPWYLWIPIVVKNYLYHRIHKTLKYHI